MKRLSTILVLGALSGSGFAITLDLTGVQKGLNTRISLNSGHDYKGVFAGELKLRLNTGSSVSNFIGMCTDADINVASGNWGVTISNTNSLNPNGARIGNLVNTYMPSLTNDVQARALQLVIWELSEETSGTFNLTNGTFRAKEMNGSTLNSATVSAANTLFANMGTGVALFYKSAFSHGHQKSQNMVAPVPEPASMAVVGIGLLGLLRRRRNRG